MSVDLIKKKFELTTFNQDFTNYLKKQKNEELKRDEERLKTLNQTIYEKKISNMSMTELLYEWKDSLIGFIDDIIHFNFNVSELFKDNRLFFLGITIIIIIILFYFYYWFVSSNEKINNDTNINISFAIPNISENKIKKIKSLFSKE
jgi:hypothetical protein